MPARTHSCASATDHLIGLVAGPDRCAERALDVRPRAAEDERERLELVVVVADAGPEAPPGASTEAKEQGGKAGAVTDKCTTADRPRLDPPPPLLTAVEIDERTGLAV